MDCSTCPIHPIVDAFIKANLPDSLNRYKSVEIHNLVGELCAEMKTLCSGCSKNDRPIQRKMDALKKAWNQNSRPLFDAILKSKKDMKGSVENLQHIFSAICLTCSRESNDDNPSNKGQQFYSLDSGSCRHGSGKAATSHTDDNDVISRADWIALHAAPEIEQTYVQENLGETNGKPPEEMDDDSLHSLTGLPSDVEDILRQEGSKWFSLSLQDKLLLACVMSGLNLTEFSDLKWIPSSFKDPRTGQLRPITKQAAHARWNQMVAKIPYLQLLVQTRSGRKKEAMRGLNRENLGQPTNILPKGFTLGRGRAKGKNKGKSKVQSATLLVQQTMDFDSDETDK